MIEHQDPIELRWQLRNASLSLCREALRQMYQYEPEEPEDDVLRVLDEDGDLVTTFVVQR